MFLFCGDARGTTVIIRAELAMMVKTANFMLKWFRRQGYKAD